MMLTCSAPNISAESYNTTETLLSWATLADSVPDTMSRARRKTSTNTELMMPANHPGGLPALLR
jgi:hypothetical protein